MLAIRDSLQNKDMHRLRVEGWKKILHANGNEKKVGVAVLLSDTKWTLKQECNERWRRAIHNKVVNL